LYYGSFLPLQGVEIIIRAAVYLKDIHGLNFRIIGQGLLFSQMRALAEQYGLENLSFLPPVRLDQLPDEIARADICLCGHFSSIPKAARVIAGKTFQCIAMGKPVVVGENPANRELLTPDVDAIFCAMNDPAALADAIRQLAQNSHLREELGRRARQSYLSSASQAVINAQVKQLVQEMIG
jgi:glycosyltransferase involved in cell wall biosynthesis